MLTRRSFFIGSVALTTNARIAASQVVTGLAPLSYPGFSTFPTPRTFDRPGTVFRVTPDGRRFSVGDISVPVQSGSEYIGNLEQSSDWNVSVLARFLNLVNITDTTGGQKSSVHVVLGSAARKSTYDGDIDIALKAANLNMTRPGSYFIIRDVISVDQIEYALSESWVAALGASIDARPEARGQASFSWKGTNSTTLVQRFAESHNIFYLPERLLKPFGSDAAGVIRVKVDDPLSWIDTNE